MNLFDIWGSRAGDLVETLLAVHTWRQRFAILDRAFLSTLNPSSPQPQIAWAWRRLARTHGSAPIQRLADEIGWGRRRFSGRFRDVIGVTPKSAARVFRFERACRLIKDERPGLAHVAASCGYFDQAHMTREWNAFAGCSPRAWIAPESSHFYKTTKSAAARMNVMNLNPRIGLSFDGNCEAAFRFYERCFNGKIEFLLRWGESPMAKDAPPEWREKILHARLVVGDTPLLGADSLPGTYKASQGFSLLLSLDDAGDTERLFRELSENGTVQMPLQETFWAHRFGVVRDRFGIAWTINYEKS